MPVLDGGDEIPRAARTSLTNASNVKGFSSKETPPGMLDICESLSTE